MNKTYISFTKMHGLGNDFVVIDAIKQNIDLPTLPISLLANRHLGIGFDQLLIIQKNNDADDADFYCYIFNADGSEAEQCGNGLRCVARYIQETGLFAQDSLRIKTKGGIFNIKIKDYQHISITMGIPHIKKINMMLSTNHHKIGPLTVLSLGNPHAILTINNEDTIPISDLNSLIVKHPDFSDGINVGFMHIVNRQHIYLRTIERGVGETNACGSNACAAVVAGILHEQLDNQVKVEFRHGSLLIEWHGKNQPVKMTGSATLVFTGQFKQNFVQ